MPPESAPRPIDPNETRRPGEPKDTTEAKEPGKPRGGVHGLGRAGIVLAVVWMPLLVGALWRTTIDRTPVAASGTANLESLWPLWITAGVVWLGLTLLLVALVWRPLPPATWVIGRTAIIVLAVGIATRVAVVLLHEPALSDDVYRYVFDGRNTASGLNPFTVAPALRVGVDSDTLLERPLGLVPAPGTLIDGERWPGEAALVPLVNNPELHTIYLPTSQLLFATAGAVANASATSPAGGARLFRAVFAGLDVVVITLLLVALRQQRRSPWWAALYAWHPLPIIELAGSGHQDVVGLMLLVLTLVIARRWPRRVWGWTAVLAGAVLVKPVVLPVATFLLRGRSARAWIASGLIGAAVCLTIAAPFVLGSDGTPLENLQATASRFTLKWAHFGGVYEPLLSAIEGRTPDWSNDEQETLARRICLGLVGIAWAAAFGFSRDRWAACRVVLFAMVIFSPTAHAWYMLWPLVAAVGAMSPAVWIASITLLAGYAQLGDVVTWTVPPRVMAAAWAPVYAAIAVDMTRLAVGRIRKRRTPEPENS